MRKAMLFMITSLSIASFGQHKGKSVKYPVTKKKETEMATAHIYSCRTLALQSFGRRAGFGDSFCSDVYMYCNRRRGFKKDLHLQHAGFFSIFITLLQSLLALGCGLSTFLRCRIEYYHFHATYL